MVMHIEIERGKANEATFVVEKRKKSENKTVVRIVLFPITDFLLLFWHRELFLGHDAERIGCGTRPWAQLVVETQGALFD